MSHTVSRGYHTAGKYLGVAIDLDDNLGHGVLPSLGALAAMERFFGYVLEGLNFNEGSRGDPLVPAMRGLCAFGIFSEVHSTLGRRKLSATSIRARATRFQKVASRMRAVRRVPEFGKPEQDLSQLKVFVKALIPIAEREQARHFHRSDDD